MHTTREALEQRIQSGAAPERLEELEAALSAPPQERARALAWALAHRGASGGALAGAIEDAAARAAAELPYESLAAICGALKAYCPAGLLDPRVRGAVHLALELDLLGTREAFLVLSALLGDDERFDALLRRAARGPLGARLAAASIARGVGLAATFAGSVEAVVGAARASGFEQIVDELFRDRDPAVGVRAAWAAGVLGARAPVLAKLVDDGMKRGAGVAARRAMAARTARFVIGEDDDEAYLEELREGIGRADVFVRGAAIQAMQLGLRVAPGTVTELVTSLVAGAPFEVLSAAAAFAASIPDAARRASVEDAIRAEAAKRGDARDPSLRFWLGPRGAEAEGVLSALAAARAAVQVSTASAREASAELLARVGDAIAALARADAVDEIDQALDVALFDAPLLPDALVASAKDDAERAARAAAWAETLDALTAPRLARVRAAADDATARERLRRLARALDAHPRKETDETFVARCREATRALLAVAEPEEGTSKRAAGRASDRALAMALAAALEPQLATGALRGPDVVGVLARLPSIALARHLAGATTHAELASALHALVRLAALAGERPKKDADVAHGRSLAKAAHDLVETLARFAAVDLVTDAMRALDDAIAGVLRAAEGAADVPVAALWVAAVESLDAALRVSAAKLDLRPRPPLDTEDVARGVTSLLVANKLAAAAPGEKTLGAARASKEVNRALPKIFCGLLDGLVLAGVAVRAAATASSRKTAVAPPPGGLAPGKKIADYVVEQVLGSGGMGHCVLVRRRLEVDQANARRWVLKLPQKEEYVEAFRNEALALLFLAKAAHPSIVRFVSYVDYGYRLPFLVMEHVAGEGLDRRLGKGPLPARELYGVAAQLADAVAKSHSMSIGHHDIKPGNIILAAKDSREARAVLVDWGLAGAAFPWAGTPEYMAPERFDFARGKFKPGATPSPQPADVWALGCVLAEMASGRPLVHAPLAPEDVGSEASILSAYAKLDPQFQRNYACEALAKNALFMGRRLDRALEGGAPGFASLVRAMLKVAPDARPKAEDVVRELRALLAKAG